MNRSLFRLFVTYAIIAFTIFLCETVSFWFYPIAVFILGSQYLTLTLFGHEGVHGLIHRNRSINRLVARFLCHFPLLISHAHFSMNHLRHHRNLGTADDPDVAIYQVAYPSLTAWVQQSFLDIINLSMQKKFLAYFNGSADYLRGQYPFKIKTDYLEFFIFWLAVLVMVFYLKIQVGFLLYWFIPILVFLPWMLLLNSYQHYSEEGPLSKRTYNILFKSKIVQEFLFPINVNYHETHHHRPNVPYYELPQLYTKTNNSIAFDDFSKKVFSSQMNKTL